MERSYYVNKTKKKSPHQNIYTKRASTTLHKIKSYEAFDTTRISPVNNLPYKPGPVIYWMSRDQRVNDNWALIYAQEQALKNKQPFYVIFNLVPRFLQATLRQYDFMLKGLAQVEKSLRELNIPFYMLLGNPIETIPEFIEKNKIGMIVSDFSPMRINRMWKREVGNKISVKFDEVDSHNVIPVWVTSDKEEYAAYTIRSKINEKLPGYLTEFPKVINMTENINVSENNNLSNNNNNSENNKVSENNVNWEQLVDNLEIDKTILPVDWITPGEDAAKAQMWEFINNRLGIYGESRNDPNLPASTDLSPWLHFGHISSQRIVIEITKSQLNNKNTTKNKEELPNGVKEIFEQLIIRKELCDNYCYYNDEYDKIDGFPKWGIETLDIHREDPREYIYSLEEFENAKTHDKVWNAAQFQMLKSGKMHGYLRMYWAKKILEWTETPERALEYCIYLNDKYELDGRDPNGYVGIAWSIGGLHDRQFYENPVFGTIRKQTYNGIKKNIDIYKYIKRWGK